MICRFFWFTAGLLFSLNAISQEITEIHDTLTFDGSNAAVLVDTSGQSLWQIGRPGKLFFDSAFSAPRAIMTDTSNAYPPGQNAYFECAIPARINTFISIRHKFDTDTLQDGGYMAVSFDNGQTWANIIQQGDWNYCINPATGYAVQNLYTAADTLANGQTGFSGHSGGWVYTQFGWSACLTKHNHGQPSDTLRLRFHFTSDSMHTGSEGWMIDQIRLLSVKLPGGSQKLHEKPFFVLQNPAANHLEICLSRPFPSLTLQLFSLNGRLLMEASHYNTTLIALSTHDLEKGLYVLTLVEEGHVVGAEKIIVQ